MQRLAIACGNKPYADERICPTVVEADTSLEGACAVKSSEILITARALINTPERWVKGRKPGCWCAVDAIIAVAPDEAQEH